MTRRSYSGAARRTSLTAPLGLSDTTLSIADSSGWPTGANGPFFLVLSRGTANEEKVLASSRTAGLIAVAQRGADGTAPLAHNIDATVEHVWTGTDADESNEHVNRTSSAHGTSSAVVGVDDSQRLKNKIISGLENTITDVPIGSVDGLAAEQAAQDAATAQVQTNLNTETSARQSADSGLDARITTNASNITAEANARQAADDLLLPKAGGTVTGALAVGGAFTANGTATVQAPTAAGHAATKKYVDDLDTAQAAAIAAERPTQQTGSLTSGVSVGTGGAAVGGSINVAKAGLYLVEADHGFYNAGTATRAILGVVNPSSVLVAGSVGDVPAGTKSNVSFSRVVRLGTGSHTLRGAASAGTLSTDAANVVPATWSVTWLAP